MRVEIMEKKNSLLKEFLRLTALQKQALTGKNMERFTELLDAKQAVIAQVDLLDDHITAAGNAVVPTGLELVARQYLQQIRVLDTEINELMKQNLSDTIKSINELQTARRTETAYRNNAGTAHSYFVNKQR